MQSQMGSKHVLAKPMKGFGPGVLEVISDRFADTFRAVYVVRLTARVYVLHCFQKKSKRGIATPKRDLEVIKERLKRAAEIHEALEQ